MAFDIPIYYLSILCMPFKVVGQVERSMRNFFWEGSDAGNLKHLVRWNIFSKSLDGGGWEIGGLKVRNQVLLAKGVGDFVNWRRVISSIHGLNFLDGTKLVKRMLI